MQRNREVKEQILEEENQAKQKREMDMRLKKERARREYEEKTFVEQKKVSEHEAMIAELERQRQEQEERFNTATNLLEEEAADFD